MVGIPPLFKRNVPIGYWLDVLPGSTEMLVVDSAGNVASQTIPSGGGGVTDHGALTGLADDDHSQYHTDARGDARYSALGHTHASYLALAGGTMVGTIYLGGTTSSNASIRYSGTQVHLRYGDDTWWAELYCGAIVMVGNLGITGMITASAGLSVGGGSLYTYGNSINGARSSNFESLFYFNYVGYLEGTTQFRNLMICDGKTIAVCLFTGSDKSTECYGPLRHSTGTYTDASNYVRGKLSSSSSAVILTAETAGTGADDIDVSLVPAGAGVVKFGTHSAVGAETITGYITIKDAAGNTRKIPVIS